MLENLVKEVPVLILFDAPPAECGNWETADDLPENVLSLIEQSISSAAGGIPDDLSEDNVATLPAMAGHCVRLLDAHESRKFGGKSSASRRWDLRTSQTGRARGGLTSPREEWRPTQSTVSMRR